MPKYEIILRFHRLIWYDNLIHGDVKVFLIGIHPHRIINKQTNSQIKSIIKISIVFMHINEYI